MGKTEFECTPFESMAEMWFWFMAANEAKNDGARYTSGSGDMVRPCEPTDILCIMDRLYRNRVITIEHLRVLKHYGELRTMPDKYNRKQRRSWGLWNEAFAKMRPVCERKGIVEKEDPMRWLSEQRDRAMSKGLRVIQGGAFGMPSTLNEQLSMNLQTV